MMKEKPYIARLSLEIRAPVNKAFIKEARKIPGVVILHLCPDTGSDEVRRLLGRTYTNEDVLKSIRLCHEYHIPVTNFFSVGLAGETEAHMKETWELWKRLDEMDHRAMANGYFGGLGSPVPIGGQILGPIVLDPGSRAFDNPGKYGYKLLYKNLEEYISWLSKPSWHHWLNYETAVAGKHEIVEMIHRSVEFTIDQRERYGIYSNGEAYYEKCMVEADRAVIKKIDQIMEIKDPGERMRNIISVRLTLDEMEKRRMFFPE